MEHLITYQGTDQCVADTLPVPRCRLPVDLVFDKHRRTTRKVSHVRAGRRSHSSPLDSLRRHEAQGQDEEPAKPSVELLKLCMVPSMFAATLVSVAMRQFGIWLDSLQ